MTRKIKNIIYAKYKGEKCKFYFLQNIKHDKLKVIKIFRDIEKSIKEFNHNYFLKNFLYSKIENNRINKLANINCLEDIIDDSKDQETIKYKVPKEVYDYKYNINEYCKNMNLELISDNMDMRVDDKLIIGLGNPSVLETSMTIHHVYGVPYLPGQALKGIFRKYFVDEVMENKERDEIDLKDGISKDLYSKLFGDDFESENEGKVKKSGIVFFDAFPIENYKIDQDIINVHYNNYYQENKFPDGTDDPNLVNFYVVKDTTFKLLFALDKNIFEGYECLFGKLKKYIKMALEDYGIGAKTAIGYGYLQSINNN